jgi:hypothetical protein
MSDCTCKEPGYCSRHRRFMPEAFWELCRTSQAYYDVFQADTLNRQTRGCSHRGQKIDEGTADLCGRKGDRFPIYSCGLHGECVIGAFCKRQKWQSCLQCSDLTTTT